MLKHFEKNDKGRDFVVGDIHGCFELLKAKLLEIGFDSEVDRLFSVGDLVDRGELSTDSVKWITYSWFHAVRGNHEQMAIEYCDGIVDKQLYKWNGGQWFMDLTEPEQKCFAELFNQLPIAIEIETNNGLVGIVHAEQPFYDWNVFRESLGNLAVKESIVRRCLWNRERWKNNDLNSVDGVHKIYVGHTPVDAITELGNTVYIDTGAVFGGVLSVVQIN